MEDAVRYGDAREEFALPEDALPHEGGNQEGATHEEVVQLASEIMVAYIESLALPPTLHFPKHKVDNTDVYRLFKVALNSMIRVQRRLAVNVAAGNLLLNGFPPEVIEHLAEEVFSTIDESLGSALKGENLEAMIQVYRP